MASGSSNQDLTPTRIRGKKRSLLAESLQKSKRTTTPETAISKISRRRRHKASFAPIELLPKELIDHIFSFTLNPNLPRSSLVLAHVLAGKRTLDWHCRRLFRTFSYDMHGIEQIYTHVDSNAVETRSQIFKARSDTLIVAGVTGDFFISLCQSIVDEEKQRLLSATNSGFDDQPWFLPDVAKKDIESVVSMLQVSFRDQFYIPSKLLRYPLAADSRRFLAFLVRSGARVNWFSSLDGEKAKDAWSRAVRARDYRLVHILMSRGIDVRPSQDELESALEAINWDAYMFRLIAICYGRPLYCSYWPFDRASRGQFEDGEYLPIIDRESTQGPSPRTKLSYSKITERCPHVWIKALARHPEGSPGRAILDEIENHDLARIMGQLHTGGRADS